MITNKLMVAVTALIFGGSSVSYFLAKHKATRQIERAGQYQPFSSAYGEEEYRPEPQAGDVIVPPLKINNDYGSRSKSHRERYEDEVQSRYRRPTQQQNNNKREYRRQQEKYLVDHGAGRTYDYESESNQPRRVEYRDGRDS